MPTCLCHMPYFTMRKVSKSGGSYHVSLPAEWVKSNNVQNGTKLQLISDEFVAVFPGRDYSAIEIGNHFDRLRDIAKVVMNK